MDILKKRTDRRRKNAIYREIPIYTTEEARNKGIPFVHWQDATPDHSHVETDDGYVVPVIVVKKYGAKWFVKTEIGPAFKGPRERLKWLERKAYGDYWALKPANWIDHEVQSARFKRAVKMYAKQIFENKVDLAAVGKFYRPEIRNSAWGWRRIIKNKKVQQIVAEEIEKLYEEQGITKRTVINLEQEAIQMARDSEDGNLLLKVAQQLGKRLGMDQETKLLTTDSIEMSQITRDLVEQIEENKKMKLKRVIQHPKSEVIENATEGEESTES